MIEIDLLKYHNLSQSEIHELENNETELKKGQLDIEEKEVRKEFPTSFLILAILLFFIAIALYFTFFDNQNINSLIKKDGKNIIKEVKQTNNISTDTSIFVDNQSEKTNFTEDTIKTDNKTKIINPSVTSVDQNSHINKIKFSVLFEDINKDELVLLKKLLKSKNLKYEVDRTKLIENKIYRLYKQDPKGKEKLLDRNVVYIKTFLNRDKAVEYAKKNNFSAIILVKNKKERHYFIRVYPFLDQKDAENFIKKNKFEGKTIKVIKFSS
jgi:uncharacterized protein (UPF0333 family)